MIEIFTLGSWDITKDKKSIIASKRYQEKLVSLFKYLLVFQGQKLSPEKIIDDLLASEDYYEPKNTLRTRISRVRRMFDYNDFFSIRFESGYYIFQLEEDVIIDHKEFERILKKANMLVDSRPEEAILLIDKALQYYKGDLFDIINDDWIVPLRARYNRLYIESIYNYLRILKNQGNFFKIVEVTEKAVRYQPYESLLNAYLIEGLIKLEQKENALHHYQYFTNKLYNDLRMEPSNHIKKAYEKLKDQGVGSELGTNLKPRGSIEDILSRDCSCEDHSHCKIDLFNILYNDMPIDQSNIDKKEDYLILVDLKDQLDNLDVVNIKENMDLIREIAEKNIRGDDLIFQCNLGPILLVLYNTSYFEISKIKERLDKAFKEKIASTDLLIDLKLQTI